MSNSLRRKTLVLRIADVALCVANAGAPGVMTKWHARAAWAEQ